MLSVCWDARRWLAVDSLTSPTRPSFESRWWCGLSQCSSPTTSCASQHQFTTTRLFRRSFSLRWDSRFLTTLGVGRSLSSVDNIGCLHGRLFDNRFGGIRLESDEQATSLTPTGLNQRSQTSRASGARRWRDRRRQRPISRSLSPTDRTVRPSWWWTLQQVQEDAP